MAQVPVTKTKVAPTSRASTKPKKTAESPSALQAALKRKLDESALDAQDAALLKLRPTTGVEAGAAGLKFALSGFQIPYFTLAGDATKFFRYRYLEDTRSGFGKMSGEKPTRYVQPSGTAPELYMPPYIDWKHYIDDPENRIVFTEGELKAACATKHGVPTIGLGGVWSFKSKSFRKTILDTFKQLKLKGRHVVICFDSDAAINPDIKRAEQAFAKELVALGAEVYIARIPYDDPLMGKKTGVDDYIVAHGIEAFEAHVLQGAENFGLCEELYKLNEEIVLVESPGFIHRLRDGVSMGHADFKNLHYAHRNFVDYSDPEKPKQKNAADAWLKWPQRATVKCLCYEPGHSSITEDGRLNAWKGWGVEPCKGDVQRWHQLVKHIFNGDKRVIKWFEQWAAWPLQNPGAKVRSAVVVWGRATGTGKSLLGYTLGRIYGENFNEISDQDLDPNKGFNSWAVNKQFVLADDITGHNNRKLANKLKVMVTRETLEVNLKYVREYTVRDCIQYYFTSNDPDAFYLDETDRRFLIHEVLGTKLADTFYRAYDTWYKSAEGTAALFHYLLHEVDCSDFNPMAEPPMTEAKHEMIRATRTDIEDWIMNVRDNPDAYLKLGGDLYTAEELLALYDPAGVKNSNAVLMGRKLAVCCVTRLRSSTGVSQVRSETRGGKMVRLYALKNADKWVNSELQEAVAHYDAHRRMLPEVVEARAKGRKPKY
jgi:hypothetical protein